MVDQRIVVSSSPAVHFTILIADGVKRQNVNADFWYRDGLRKQFGSVLNNSARFDKHMFLHHLAEGIREEQRIQ